MSGGSSLGHVPGGKWEFDDGVAKVFDDMLWRSIPQIAVMRQTVADLAEAVMADHLPKRVLDLGSSNGGSLAPLIVSDRGRIRPEVEAVAVESSPAMLANLRARFSSWIEEKKLRVVDQDLREAAREGERWGSDDFSVALCVLTLQFVPINYRQSLVAKVFARLRESGAMILVEKVLGDSAAIDDLMTRRYRAMKIANGYGEEEVDRKALSLEGVLVPVTAAWNVDLLRQAGFRHVDCFWAWMCFRGWIAVK